MTDTTLPERLRLFIALTLPEAVKDEIEKAQSDLRRALRGGEVRWAKREQFHLTLRFLGSVAANRLVELEQVLQVVGREFGPMALRASRIGFFPRPHSPRVVWAGVQDSNDRLRPLQAAVQSASQSFTEEGPEDRFSAHITLGRVKAMRRPEAEALARAGAKFENRLFGEWTAHEFEIIRSQLSPQGSRYTTLARLAFRATGQGT